MFRETSSPHLSRRQLLGRGALLGAGAFAAGSPFSGIAMAQADSTAWPQVSALMDRYIAQRKVANMVAALGWGQALPQFLNQGSTTFTNGISAGPDTLYRIYSMTKPITGMAAIMCIDDGMLSLDQPLADILPAFADMQVQKEYDGAITPDNLEPAARPITIRHLLTHTAGLGYGIIQQGPIVDAFNEAGLVPGQVTRLQIPGVSRAPAVRSLASFADRLAQMPLVLQPGTRWNYSVSLDLLGRVIEVVTGKAFDTFLQQRIFDPCGMSSTWFHVPASEAGRLTANYVLMGGNLVPIDLPASSVYLDEPAFPFGGSGLVSSARDYDRFLQMLAGYGMIDGTRVMSEPAVRLATSDLFPAELAAENRINLGGLNFNHGAGGLVGTGVSAGLFGWFGAAGTTGLVNMKYGLRHSLMTQYMPSQEYDLQNEFPMAVAADAAALM